MIINDSSFPYRKKPETDEDTSAQLKWLFFCEIRWDVPKIYYNDKNLG